MIKEDLDIDKDNYCDIQDVNDVWVSKLRTHEEVQKRFEELENGGEWSLRSYSLNERAETYHKSSSVLKNNHPLMIMLNEERMVRTIFCFQRNMIFEMICHF